MPRGFKDTGAYPQWPQVADAVIEALRPLGTRAARPAPPCLAIMWQTLATPTEGSPMRKRGSEDHVHLTIRLPRALYDAMHATVRQRFPQWGQTDRPADSRLIRAALRH